MIENGSPIDGVTVIGVSSSRATTVVHLLAGWHDGIVSVSRQTSTNMWWAKAGDMMTADYPTAREALDALRGAL